MEVRLIIKAIKEYNARQNRSSHPAGEFDKKGRFYLSEVCDCCKGIRSPSAAYPYSQMVHGRSAKHICNLLGLSSEQTKVVNRYIKRRK